MSFFMIPTVTFHSYYFSSPGDSVVNVMWERVGKIVVRELGL